MTVKPLRFVPFVLRVKIMHSAKMAGIFGISENFTLSPNIVRKYRYCGKNTLNDFFGIYFQM